jgi:hypothetical protein
MTRMLKLLGVLAGLLGVAGSAVAGPIQWSYATSLGPEGGGSGIWIGDYIRRDSYAPNGWAHANIVGQLQAADPTGPQTGAAHLALGGYHPGFYSLQWDDAGFALTGPVRQQFQVQLTITDAASGQSGVVTAYGTGQAHQHDDMLAAPTFGFLLSQGADQSLTLGGNEYAVKFHATEDVGIADGVGISADVTASAANTPEPGTLLLAGLGFASCGGLWLRRRRA